MQINSICYNLQRRVYSFFKIAILQNALRATFLKNHSHGFLSYTKYYLTTKNAET